MFLPSSSLYRSLDANDTTIANTDEERSIATSPNLFDSRMGKASQQSPFFAHPIDASATQRTAGRRSNPSSPPAHPSRSMTSMLLRSHHPTVLRNDLFAVEEAEEPLAPRGRTRQRPAELSDDEESRAPPDSLCVFIT
jgi:hypothetical protein